MDRWAAVEAARSWTGTRRGIASSSTGMGEAQGQALGGHWVGTGKERRRARATGVRAGPSTRTVRNWTGIDRPGVRSAEGPIGRGSDRPRDDRPRDRHGPIAHWTGSDEGVWTASPPVVGTRRMGQASRSVRREVAAQSGQAHRPHPKWTGTSAAPPRSDIRCRADRHRRAADDADADAVGRARLRPGMTTATLPGGEGRG
jgi:hypothetical protein